MPSARATKGASVRARFAIHSATGTVNPRLRENASAAGSARASHLRRMYLPTPFLIFSPSGKTQGELGDHGIKERRAPFESVRHQAAIDLEQKIVGQPVGAIERLRLLEPRAALGRDALLGVVHALTPAARVAQDAKPVEQAAAAHLAAAEPARPERAAIASVPREQLIAALAAEHDLHVPRRLLGKEIGRKNRVVRGRIVHRGGNRRAASSRNRSR